jgi:hypothetical protein
MIKTLYPSKPDPHVLSLVLSRAKGGAVSPRLANRYSRFALSHRSCGDGFCQSPKRYNVLKDHRRPSHKPVVWYKGFLYQAASWKTARRVVAKVEFHAGELFPRIGFIVTNLETPSRAVVRFYNKRGTAEQWIKEGKQAVKMTRLSCHRFRSNQVRLALSLLAYNLGNLWRRLALPRRIENWSLTSLQQRLVKTGGRLVQHARYYWLLLAEGHMNRRRFGAMLGRIVLLPVPAG